MPGGGAGQTRGAGGRMLEAVRILFATDGSRGSGIAEDFLLALPLSSADDVTLVASAGPSERESAALLSRCHWRFAARNIPVRNRLRPGPLGAAAEAVAVELGAELVVVGGRTPGFAGPLAGDLARGLAASGTVSLLVVRERREAPRRLLVAIDASDDARAAVDLVARLPLPAEARVHLVRLDVDAEGTGVPDPVLLARSRLRARLDGTAVLDRAHLGERILRDALAHGSDVIVLGVRDRPSAMGLLRPSVADHVFSHAHCAVLLARAPLAHRRVEVHAAILALREC